MHCTKNRMTRRPAIGRLNFGRSALALVFAGALAIAVDAVAADKPGNTVKRSAGKPAPRLALPELKTESEIAIPLPKGCRPAEAVQHLLEVGGRGGAFGECFAAIGPDGTPREPKGELLAILPGSPAARGTIRFAFDSSESGLADHGGGVVGPASGFHVRPLDDKSLELREDDKPVLVYNFGTITSDKVPAKDARRSRACFVHPLYGLSGEVLTDDFPKDHYHHVGLFWAWPHVKIDGKEYDLWTYKDIHQKFLRWLGQETGHFAAVLGVENGWFIGAKQVMTERIWFHVYSATMDHRAIDVTLVLIPGDKPVTLIGAPQKSYGGLNIRFAPRQTNDPKLAEKLTQITTAAGVDAKDLPDTRLTWADLTAKFIKSNASSGAAIFVDPRHPDYPPTWLTRHYGILCVGWPGVKPKTLEPGVPVRLDYRLWIHGPGVDLVKLRTAYESYTATAKAHWEE